MILEVVFFLMRMFETVEVKFKKYSDFLKKCKVDSSINPKLLGVQSVWEGLHLETQDMQ